MTINFIDLKRYDDYRNNTKFCYKHSLRNLKKNETLYLLLIQKNSYVDYIIVMDL